MRYNLNKLWIDVSALAQPYKNVEFSLKITDEMYDIENKNTITRSRVQVIAPALYALSSPFQYTSTTNSASGTVPRPQTQTTMFRSASIPPNYKEHLSSSHNTQPPPILVLTPAHSNLVRFPLSPPIPANLEKNKYSLVSSRKESVSDGNLLISNQGAKNRLILPKDHKWSSTTTADVSTDNPPAKKPCTDKAILVRSLMAPEPDIDCVNESNGSPEINVV